MAETKRPQSSGTFKLNQPPAARRKRPLRWFVLKSGVGAGSDDLSSTSDVESCTTPNTERCSNARKASMMSAVSAATERWSPATLKFPTPFRRTTLGAPPGNGRRVSDQVRSASTSVNSDAAELDRSPYSVISALHTVTNVALPAGSPMANRKGKPKLIAPEGTPVVPKRLDKVKVFIHIVFLKIGEIDTVKETFSADVFIQARWREPLFDMNHDLNTSEVNWNAYWNPRLYVDNSSGYPRETVWYAVKFNEKMEAYVFERRRVVGKFVENLELQEFPFDTQDVTVTIASERSVREVELEEDYSELSTVNVQTFVDEQEWRLYNNVETRRDEVIRIYQGDDFCHSSFSALCHASRRYGFYIWNIMFVMFLIGSLIFATFSIDYMKRENRLQVGFILLLATVTFKFAVNSSLPRISYLTYLDKYILASMSFMAVICSWHAVAATVIQSTVADKWAFASFAAFFLISHFSFWLFIYFKAIRKRLKFVENERIHKARLRQLEQEDTGDAGVYVATVNQRLAL